MKGLHLSRIQAAAVELVLVSEERLKAQDFVDRFKLAVVSHDPQRWVSTMFPDWQKDEPTTEVVTEDTDLEDTEGTWVFEDSVTQEEAEREFAELMADRGGVIGFDDLPDEGWM